MTEVFTVEQLAARWQVTGQHIRNMARRGQVPSFKIGSLTRFRVSDVIAHETCPAPAPKAPPTASSSAVTSGMSNGGKTDEQIGQAVARRILAKRGYAARRQE